MNKTYRAFFCCHGRIGTFVLEADDGRGAKFQGRMEDGNVHYCLESLVCNDSKNGSDMEESITKMGGGWLISINGC